MEESDDNASNAEYNPCADFVTCCLSVTWVCNELFGTAGICGDFIADDICIIPSFDPTSADCNGPTSSSSSFSSSELFVSSSSSVLSSSKISSRRTKKLYNCN